MSNYATALSRADGLGYGTIIQPMLIFSQSKWGQIFIRPRLILRSSFLFLCVLNHVVHDRRKDDF
ncbi:MAG: hypothetical protein WCA63_08495, partial [Gallionella sp.]